MRHRVVSHSFSKILLVLSSGRERPSRQLRSELTSPFFSIDKIMRMDIAGRRKVSHVLPYSINPLTIPN